ncbi:MAG: gfo/Idh/MocA family oxidoreductase, partial [Planctomycetota bacterium]
MSINAPLNRKLNMGLVGGGIGSFIGRVHSIAAGLDNRSVLVAGAFSSNPERSKQSAPGYAVDESRAYGSYSEM